MQRFKRLRERYRRTKRRRGFIFLSLFTKGFHKLFMKDFETRFHKDYTP